MRAIHPTAFRVGKMDRWSSDQFNLNHAVSLTVDTIQTILQSYLGSTYNLFIIKCDLQGPSSSNSVGVSVVFYKYIQRARLAKSLHMALLLATGAFKTKPPLYHVRLAQGFIVPQVVVNQLESMLKEAFGVHIRLHFHNISKIAEGAYTKDRGSVTQALQAFMAAKDARLAKTGGARSWPPLESRLERHWINPLSIRDSHHRYKAFASTVYALDVIMIMLYASMYSLSHLLADVIIRGLLRNMKRQKQFLSLIETTIDHFRSFRNWPFKPYDWCIAIHGKLGSGSIRSRSYYIKTGYLPLQTIMLPIDYSYRSAETKYGSIGVKVWMSKQV